MKETVIRLPELPKTLQPEAFDQVEIDDPYLKGTRYEKESMPSELTERIDAYQVCFQNVSFANLTFDRGSFEDIRFEQCDLTGCHFQETRFHRVSFVGCRMTGVQFEDCTLDHLTIQEGLADYVQFIRSTVRHQHWSETTMKEAQFFEVKPTQWKLEAVRLTDSQWIETPLKGLDLRQTELSGITIDPRFLPGAVITEEQAVAFARLLGLVIP